MARQSNLGKKYKRYRDNVQEETQDNGIEGAEMSFEQIAEELNMTIPQVKMIYVRAMKKLKLPNLINRDLWDYDNIGSNDTESENGGTRL